ncbi:glucose 1-dehydrogenase [Paraburkholderia fungorum]|uniref:glucose 1-dehydrogenase n=1 Tax=Paraburkholderia fungorum TaxID=134537 RepID=UPI0020981507|nr:glucose 1-dehydrogenase [Paraburkholderia fungorum]USX06739.1 glucose 1-dehydrogenase [Paraburkholderia fungorum]
MRGLKEKVVVITGAAGGIGKSLVRRFCEEGAFVVAVDVNADALDTLGRELDAHAANISPVQLDITDHEAVVKAMTEVATQRGGIDVLVNNAGWDVAMQFLETDPAFWQKVIAINLLGPLNLHHAILPLMTNRKQGKIINISSDAGRVGSSGESVYSACKGGVIAFSKTIARECARNNINVNVVCPGPTDTALLQSFLGEGEFGQKIYEGLKRAIPLKRLGQPDDIPGAVAFLASDDANFITGQVISVSGGLTMHG